MSDNKVAPDAHAGDTAPGDERRIEEDIATGVGGYLATIDRLVAGSQVAFMQMQTDFGVAHRANPIR